MKTLSQLKPGDLLFIVSDDIIPEFSEVMIIKESTPQYSTNTIIYPEGGSEYGTSVDGTAFESFNGKWYFTDRERAVSYFKEKTISSIERLEKAREGIDESLLELVKNLNSI